MDPFLGPQLDRLIQRLHASALAAYCTPFCRVDIAEVAELFKLSSAQAVHVLGELIRAGTGGVGSGAEWARTGVYECRKTTRSH